MKKIHIILILITTIATFAFVSVRLDIVKSSYKINHLKQTQQDLRDEIGSLNAKLNSIRSPERLESIAKKRLGMHPPVPSQVVLLKDEP